MNLIDEGFRRAECSARGVSKGFSPDDPRVTQWDVDQALDACMHCPIALQCLKTGMAGEEWGIWGGVNLSEGLAVPLPDRFFGLPAVA